MILTTLNIVSSMLMYILNANWKIYREMFCLKFIKIVSLFIGRLRFHDDNENDNENDNEISLSFSLRFCTQRDERLIVYISSSTTMITNRNPGRTQEMMMSAHTNFVIVLVVVVLVKS